MSTARKWNPSIMFPTGSEYKNRIVDATFGPSQKGNPMVVLSLELDSPEEIEVGEDKFVIAGQQCKYYISTGVAIPEGADEATLAAIAEKNEGMRKRAGEVLTNLGINTEAINWDNIDVNPIKGKLIYTLMEADVVERRKNPTAKQIAEAKAKGEEAVGDIMYDPIKKTPLVSYWPKVKQIFGLVPGAGTVSTAF